MSKELTPLEAFRIIKYNASESDLFDLNKLYDIIETTLKDHEELQKNYCEVVEKRGKWQEKNKNKLKALKIIKEKRVDIHNLIYSSNVEEYNKFAMNYNQELCNTLLTQEEFNLLKEILK